MTFYMEVAWAFKRVAYVSIRASRNSFEYQGERDPRFCAYKV